MRASQRAVFVRESLSAPAQQRRRVWGLLPEVLVLLLLHMQVCGSRESAQAVCAGRRILLSGLRSAQGYQSTQSVTLTLRGGATEEPEPSGDDMEALHEEVERLR